MVKHHGYSVLVDLGQVGKFAEISTTSPNPVDDGRQMHRVGLSQGTTQGLELKGDDVGSLGLHAAATEQMKFNGPGKLHTGLSNEIHDGKRRSMTSSQVIR